MTRRIIFPALFVALGLVVSACGFLKDAPPFTATISYNSGVGGAVVVSPATFEADAAFGEVQVVNNTDVKRGFAIDDLAVYETIASGHSKLVVIQEAKDGKTYEFYDQLHPGAIKGLMVVKYVAEGER
ncbi:MAG: cupredoxin domain-containing protein [Actinomycetota bacterium]